MADDKQKERILILERAERTVERYPGPECVKELYRKLMVEAITNPDSIKKGFGKRGTSPFLPRHEELPYHVELDEFRCRCVSNSRGYCYIRMNISTTDTEPDLALISRLQRSGIDISFSDEEGDSDEKTQVIIELEKKDNGFYRISAGGCPIADTKRMMDVVDLVGKVFLQAKEMPQCKKPDSDDLAASLSMTKFPLARKKPRAITKRIKEVIPELARRYVSDPMALKGPMVQFLEIGDLADIANGNNQLEEELRKRVRPIVWDAFSGSGLGLEEFKPILKRVYDALGIHEEDDQKE